MEHREHHPDSKYQPPRAARPSVSWRHTPTHTARLPFAGCGAASTVGTAPKSQITGIQVIWGSLTVQPAPCRRIASAVEACSAECSATQPVAAPACGRKSCWQQQLTLHYCALPPPCDTDVFDSERTLKECFSFSDSNIQVMHARPPPLSRVPSTCPACSPIRSA